MRLLYIASDGTLSWTEDLLDKDITPYAILSHTWGGQEVTFKDLQNHKDIAEVDARLREGYRKIFFCAEQAKRDGLEHFWVDTCCIDKSNSQELQEAINSMFRWYQKADKCYVYLSDVSHDAWDAAADSTLRGSRWFTRGWTLQELIAPESVDFFSSEGKNLGNKKTLVAIINEVTSIPAQALSGGRLSGFSVDDRFPWAQNRQTTREEDKAYCLLGIFGVYLPMIYGEGEENALNRLRDAVTMKNGKSRNAKQDKWAAKLHNWLSAPDPSTNYHKAHKQRQAETGLWLLNSSRFTKWKVNPASRLWLYGIPGSGKTILSSTVVDHLLKYCHADTSTVTVYFYFDFRDTKKQDPELMLRSLVCQLLQHSTMMPTSIDILYSSCGAGQQQPSLHDLLEVTMQVMKQLTHVYVVLDALDECKQRPELMGMLETIAGWQLDNLHLLMTSRKERDIEISLESYVKKEDTICLQQNVVDEDIKLYVGQRLSHDKSLAKWNKDVVARQEIEDALMRGARGMFRWAVCQLDTLAKCRNRAMLRKSLATLPQTLDQTYERILTAISDEDRDYAIRILQWLTFSERPLTVEEIAEVVAIDVMRDPAFDHDEVLEDPLEALSICSSLITITMEMTGNFIPAKPIIVLAHYSVREYLVSDRIRQGQAELYGLQEVKCHHLIAKNCLLYLNQFQQPLSAEIVKQSALASYAAASWSIHLLKAGDEPQLNLLAANLMSVESPAYLNWLRLSNPDHPWRYPDLDMDSGTLAVPVYYAACLGLSTVVRLLLEEGADVNVQGGMYGNALQAASARGHGQIVQLLLDKGANVNAQDGIFGTALQAASAQGYEQIVAILLGKEAVPDDVLSLRYGTALQAASIRGHKQIVKRLLDKGADVNAHAEFGGSPLQAASCNGFEQIVVMLLKYGAEVNDETPFRTDRCRYSSALQAASAHGHKEVVKILLDQGADVNAHAGFDSSPLQAASCYGFEQIVVMLLKYGAEVNDGIPFYSGRRRYSNSLRVAYAEGNEQIAKILIDAGAYWPEDEDYEQEFEVSSPDSDWITTDAEDYLPGL